MENQLGLAMYHTDNVEFISTIEGKGMIMEDIDRELQIRDYSKEELN